MRERYQREINPLPKIDLMMPLQIKYYLAWHNLIGDQKRVLYNAMGPDVGTVLLTTNAEKIIGIDANGLYAESLEDKIELFWNEIRSPKVHTKWEPRKAEWKRFETDLRHRKMKGYWDESDLNRWETSKLLALELKELGVNKKNIAISGYRDGSHTRIKFTWAYPGEKLKDREIIYLRGTLDKVLKSKKGKLINNLDCFYQKGLPIEELTPGYLHLILPRLKDNAAVAVGYKTWGENENYGELIWDNLGPMFASLGVDPKLDSLIDHLPDDDPASEMVKYGMKLHVFKRG